MIDSSTAIEQVRALPDHVREAIFIDLLKEVIRENGNGEGLVDMTTPQGEFLGTLYPPKAVQFLYDKYGPKLTPEEKAEIQRRIENPGRTFTLEEFWESIRQEDTALESTAGERGIG